MERVGPYELVGELGRGGMGVVHEVRHPELPGRRLALKRLGAGLDTVATLRFQREAELLARVRHPGVVQVHGVGRDAQGLYLVVDLVEGESLAGALRRGPFAPRAAAEVVRALAEALGALHDAGVLHRDLKPENVMLGPDGRPVLLDFGVARELDRSSLTTTGELLGTPAFMSPEQVRDARSVDARADVYGLGALLYALLAGRPPFQGSVLAVLEAVLQRGPAWPVTSEPGLDAVCRRAMALDPADRYPDAPALGEALGAWSQPRPAGWRVVPFLALALVSVGAAGLALALRPRAGRGPDPATAAATSSAPRPRPTALEARPREAAWVVHQAHDGPAGVAFVSSTAPGTPPVLVSVGGTSAPRARLWGISPESGVLTELAPRLTLPWVPTAVAADPRGGLAWCVGGAELARLNAAAWTFASESGLLGPPEGLAVGGRGRAALAVLMGLQKDLQEWRVGLIELPEARVRGGCGMPGRIHALAISGDGARVAAGSSLRGDEGGGPGRLVWLDWPGDGVRWELDLPDCPLALAFSPAGEELLVGTSTGRLLALTGSGQTRLQFGAEGPGAEVEALSLRDGRTLFSCSGGRGARELRVWDPRLGRELAPPAPLPGRPRASALSPDGRWLVVATREGSLVVHDVRR